jgi:hypothetical protein
MPNPHRETAISALVDRDWQAAGDAYTRAAHRDLGDGQRGDGTGGDVLAPGPRDRPAAGLSFLLTAGLCYRLAGVEDRARYRALTVAPLALDARDHVREGVERAVCQEFVADAAVVRGADEAATQAYDRAERLYDANHPEGPLDAATGPLFDAANSLLLHASRNYRGVEWDDLHGPDPGGEDYLAHRPRFKSQALPGAIERVVGAGQLHVPRGSTEYNNDTYRCPDCGERDVNYVGGETVCLYCSVRVEEQ